MHLKLHTPLTSSGMWQLSLSPGRQAAARNTCPASMADQWNNTAHNVLCGIIYYVPRIYSLFAKAIRFGNQLQSSPLERTPPKECRQRSAEEAPSWRADFSGARFRTCIYMSNASCDRVASPSYFLASPFPLLPFFRTLSTSSTPSPSAACPADVSLSAAWQLQLVRVHMNKHRLHP